MLAKSPLSTIRGAFIPTVGQPVSKDRNFCVMYVGPAQSGKTHCIASWPDPLYLYPDTNLATIDKFKVPYVAVPDWETFDKHLMPALRRRTWFEENKETNEVVSVPLAYRTVCIDTISALGDLLLEHITQKEGLKERNIWDAMAIRFMRTIRDLVSLTGPTDKHPGCHVVVGGHLRDKQNDSGNVIGTALDIAGRSGTQTPKHFDTNLLCRAKLTPSPGQEPLTADQREYFIYTGNPSHLIDFLGDRVGGAGTPTLPPKMGGTYPELMAAWGFPKEDSPK